MNVTAASPKHRKILTGTPEQRLRRQHRVTRSQLAKLACIPIEHVQDFEEGLPVVLESRRRLRQVLWSMKKGK